MALLDTTLEINAPIARCFDLWACAQCVPSFLRNVDKAYFRTETQEYRWQWHVGEGDATVRWETMLDTMEENSIISWHSAPNAAPDTSGAVHFTPLPGNRTRVWVEMMFNPPVKAGEYLDDVFGKQIEQWVLADLETFRHMVEQPDAPTHEPGLHVPSSENLTPLSIRVHGNRTHELRDKPAL